MTYIFCTWLLTEIITDDVIWTTIPTNAKIERGTE